MAGNADEYLAGNSCRLFDKTSLSVVNRFIFKCQLKAPGCLGYFVDCPILHGFGCYAVWGFNCQDPKRFCGIAIVNVRVIGWAGKGFARDLSNEPLSLSCTSSLGYEGRASPTGLALTRWWASRSAPID